VCQLHCTSRARWNRSVLSGRLKIEASVMHRSSPWKTDCSKRQIQRPRTNGGRHGADDTRGWDVVFGRLRGAWVVRPGQCVTGATICVDTGQGQLLRCRSTSTVHLYAFLWIMCRSVFFTARCVFYVCFCANRLHCG